MNNSPPSGTGSPISQLLATETIYGQLGTTKMPFFMHRKLYEGYFPNFRMLWRSLSSYVLPIPRNVKWPHITAHLHISRVRQRLATGLRPIIPLYVNTTIRELHCCKSGEFIQIRERVVHNGQSSRLGQAFSPTKLGNYTIANDSNIIAYLLYHTDHAFVVIIKGSEWFSVCLELRQLIVDFQSLIYPLNHATKVLGWELHVNR